MHLVDRYLAPVSRVLADAAVHVHGAARFQGVGPAGFRVPQDGRHAARAIGEREAQVGRAVALVASLHGANEQDSVDGCAIGQVGQGRCGGGEDGHWREVVPARSDLTRRLAASIADEALASSSASHSVRAAPSSWIRPAGGGPHRLRWSAG